MKVVGFEESGGKKDVLEASEAWGVCLRPTASSCDSLNAKPNEVSVPTQLLSWAPFRWEVPTWVWPTLCCPTSLPSAALPRPYSSVERTNKPQFWNLQKACLFIWGSRNPTVKSRTLGEKGRQSSCDFIRHFCMWKSNKTRNFPYSFGQLGLTYHGLWYITMTTFYNDNHQNLLSY